MNKTFIEKRIKEGVTLKDIANELKCGYSTLRKFCRENGLKSNFIRINEKYPKDLIENAARESNSFTELFLKLNVKNSGASYQRVKEKINEFNIDITHFNGKQIAIDKLNKHKKINSKSISLKNRVPRKILYKILKDKVPYKCNVCGISEWTNKKLILHIDHIDGNRCNNIEKNLQFLCPNCHSIKTYPDVT